MIKSPDYKQLQGLVEYLKFVPYDVSRSCLYSPQELYAGFDPDKPETFDSCFDTKVYKHFIAHGKRASTPVESMARTLHDHGIHIAMDKFFEQHNARQCIGVMGGHAQLRTHSGRWHLSASNSPSWGLSCSVEVDQEQWRQHTLGHGWLDAPRPSLMTHCRCWLWHHHLPTVNGWLVL